LRHGVLGVTQASLASAAMLRAAVTPRSHAAQPPRATGPAGRRTPGRLAVPIPTTPAGGLGLGLCRGSSSHRRTRMLVRHSRSTRPAFGPRGDVRKPETPAGMPKTGRAPRLQTVSVRCVVCRDRSGRAARLLRPSRGWKRCDGSFLGRHSAAALERAQRAAWRARVGSAYLRTRRVRWMTATSAGSCGREMP
jgi:hypothetical protein